MSHWPHTGVGYTSKPNVSSVGYAAARTVPSRLKPPRGSPRVRVDITLFRVLMLTKLHISPPVISPLHPLPLHQDKEVQGFMEPARLLTSFTKGVDPFLQATFKRKKTRTLRATHNPTL